MTWLAPILLALGLFCILLGSARAYGQARGWVGGRGKPAVQRLCGG